MQWLKIHCKRMLEDKLCPNYTDFTFEVVNNTVQTNIYLNYTTKEQKTKIETELRKLIEIYCPNFNFQINFRSPNDLTDPHLNPKIYFEKFKYVYQKLKTSPFSYLNKMQKYPFHPGLKGIRIRVKGKRGARKYKKDLIVGSASYHSSKKGVLRTYKGTIQTNMGTMGITVCTKKR